MASYRETQLKSFYDKVQTAGGDTCKLQVSVKDNTIADQLRAQGNKHYFNGHFVNAINEYNKSLCFAQLDGDQFNLSVAYANRADALFRMDLPRECLKSIELAEAANYPEHLRSRLTLMASRCQDKIKFSVQERPKYRLKLTHPPNPRIPAISNCLKLQQSDQFGRHVVATEALSVGDVVMIERPYIVCLRPPQRYKRCSHCMAGDQRHALIPCPKCTNAMYCSEGCLKEAFHVYHRFECKVSENLNASDEFLALALRSLLVGVSVFGGVRDFQRYVSDNESTAVHAFELDYAPERRDRKLEFLVMHQMHFMDSQMSIADRNYWMKRAAEWAHLLVQAKVFDESLPEDLRAFLRNTIYRYTITSILNCYETSQDPSAPKSEKQFATVSQHLTMAMVNHSCAPNVQRIQQAGQQVLMVVRPIAKGGQLFDNYGQFYTETGRRERQEHLFSQYGFRCGCVACLDNYPAAKRLKCKKGCGTVTSLVDLITQANPCLEARLNRAEKLAQFMQKNDQYYPCEQLNDADAELYGIYTDLVGEQVWEIKFKEFYQNKS